MVPRPAHTAFHHVADTELLRDFFEVAGDATFVLHDRSATDYFQILDLGQIREQFILNSVADWGRRAGSLARHAAIVSSHTAGTSAGLMSNSFRRSVIDGATRSWICRSILPE